MGLLQRSDAATRWFSLLAPGYDAVVSQLFWPATLQREGLERLDLSDDDTVLDVGCGTGETARLLVGRTRSVHGVDLSAEQLETADAKAPLDGCDFVRGDACSLPYADDSFDRVVSVGSVMYWEDPRAVLREVGRVTRPGGEVLVMGFNRRRSSVASPVRNAQDVVNAALFYRHGPEEAEELFRSAGWTEVDNAVTGPAWSPSLVLATTARWPSDA